MKKTAVICLILMFATVTQAADSQPEMELRSDRTLIYPQRMELTGEETLLDILEMYPDLMGAGFDDLLTGNGAQDSYQFRMDNVTMSGDLRLLLTQIKAKLISKIKICDNAGVAKGRTGDGRVIDINLLKAEEGAHGFLSLQGGSDKQLAPSANVRYGSEHTDLWSAMTYTHKDANSTVNNVESMHIQMTNRLSPRDRLLSYVTQSSSVADRSGASTSHSRNESFMARTRYFHNFNDQGTELLMLLSWAHKNAPADNYRVSPYRSHHLSSHTNSPIWLTELNTPLFTKNLSMMLGYEGDLDITRYGIDYDSAADSPFSQESRYHVMNNDIYISFNYVAGPVRLTVGDRVMFYHYKQEGYADDWSKNDTRNNFHASVVLTPQKAHQVQVAYYRKFRNPSAMNMFPEEWVNADGTYKGGNPLLEEVKTDQYKLSYLYCQPTLTGRLDGSLYHTDTNDYWTIDGAVNKKVGALSLTAGFNVYSIKPENDSRTTFADIRIVPAVRLPQVVQVSAKLIWYSYKAPYRMLADNTAFYGALQADKQLGSHWSLHAEWHDMFYSQRSAALASVMYHF